MIIDSRADLKALIFTRFFSDFSFDGFLFVAPSAEAISPNSLVKINVKLVNLSGSV